MKVKIIVLISLAVSSVFYANSLGCFSVEDSLKEDVVKGGSMISFDRDYYTIDSLRIKSNILIIQGIKNWSDPGDFFRLVVKEGDNVKLEVNNIDGWVVFGENYEVSEDLLMSNLLSSDKIMVREMSGQYYIFLFGWVYGSSPGKLTVVKLGTNPEVIFEDNFQMFSLDEESRRIVGSYNFEDTSSVVLK